MGGGGREWREGEGGREGGREGREGGEGGEVGREGREGGGGEGRGPVTYQIRYLKTADASRRACTVRQCHKTLTSQPITVLYNMS